MDQDIPENDSLKSKLADIFGTNLANVNITKSTIEIKDLKVKVPESKDGKDAFLTTKDKAGLNVRFIKAEGDEVDKLVCPIGSVEQDGKCVPKATEELEDNNLSNEAKEQVKRMFKSIASLI